MFAFYDAEQKNLYEGWPRMPVIKLLHSAAPRHQLKQVFGKREIKILRRNGSIFEVI